MTAVPPYSRWPETPEDTEIVERAAFLYDSLYAHLRRRLQQARDEEVG